MRRVRCNLGRMGGLTGLWVLAMLVAPMPSRGQENALRRVHDPTIIECDGTYYVFATGAGIPTRTSKDLIHWSRGRTVFDRLPDWAKREVPGANWIWAPDITFWNGSYYLYYSVSTFGRNRSCIGLATSPTLDPASPAYKWTDHGKVVESTPGVDDFNAIDPSLALDEKNQPWLAFGSFWSGIKLVRIDPATGKPPAGEPQLIPLARRPRPGVIEAPLIVRKGEWYYLFVSFDYCCRGVNSTYRIMVGRSKQITGPYVDRDGRAMLEGGATSVLESYGRYRGPGHNAVLLDQKGGDWLVHHFYDADRRGTGTLCVRHLTWDDKGWPVAGDPITP